MRILIQVCAAVILLLESSCATAYGLANSSCGSLSDANHAMATIAKDWTADGLENFNVSKVVIDFTIGADVVDAAAFKDDAATARYHIDRAGCYALVRIDLVEQGGDRRLAITHLVEVETQRLIY